MGASTAHKRAVQALWLHSQECNQITHEHFIRFSLYLWGRGGCRDHMLSSRSFCRHKTSAFSGFHIELDSAQPSLVGLWGFSLGISPNWKWQALSHLRYVGPALSRGGIIPEIFSGLWFQNRPAFLPVDSKTLKFFSLDLWKGENYSHIWKKKSLFSVAPFAWWSWGNFWLWA